MGNNRICRYSCTLRFAETEYEERGNNMVLFKQLSHLAGNGSIAHEAKLNRLLTRGPGQRVEFFWNHPTSRTERKY